MMFKEYISATAEFLIIRQASMAENTGIFPRENELPVCSSVLTLSLPPGTRLSFRTPRLFLSCWQGWGQKGPAPSMAQPHSQAGDDQPCIQLGLGLEPRAELRLSKHVQPWISYSQPGRVTSCVTHWTCCSYRQRFIFSLTDLSSSFCKPGYILMLCSLISSAAPRFAAWAGLKAAPAHFPVNQASSVFLLPLPAVVWEQPQPPAAFTLQFKPANIHSFLCVWASQSPVINNISLCLFRMQIHLSLTWEANTIHNSPVMVSATPWGFSFSSFFSLLGGTQDFFSHIRYWWFIVYLCSTQLVFFFMSFSAGDLYTSYIQQFLWEWLSTIRFHPTAITSNP